MITRTVWDNAGHSVNKPFVHIHHIASSGARCSSNPLNVPPISGKTISLFCNMTALIDDHTEAALEYVWIRDDITLMAEDKYMGLGTDRINVTVSTRVRLVLAHTNGWVYLILCYDVFVCNYALPTSSFRVWYGKRLVHITFPLTVFHKCHFPTLRHFWYGCMRYMHHLEILLLMIISHIIPGIGLCEDIKRT